MSNEVTESAPEMSETEGVSLPVESPETGEAPAEQDQEPQVYKVKIDGEDVEMSLEDMQRYASMGKAADKRFQDAAQLKRDAEEILRRKAEDPKGFLSEFDRSVLEEYLAEQLEQEMLSPEEQERRRKDAELEEYRQREQERQQQEQTAKQQEMEHQAAQEFETTIIQALEVSDLPKSPATVKRMAEAMYKAMEYGYDLSPQDLAAIVRDEMLDAVKHTLPAADPETLLKLLGEDVAAKIRQADLARVKGAQKFNQPKIAQQPKKTEKKGKTLDELFAEIG